MYAQPLIVGNLNISATVHNVVYLATVNNSVYAFDADNGDLFWKKNFTFSGMRPPANTDIARDCVYYQDFSGKMGIVGTPVIDTLAQAIYFVARNTDGTNFTQYLHKVNILTGAEMPGSPVLIQATVQGTGSGSVINTISFNSLLQNQRAALLLSKGIVYITWASHGDCGNYHGWIIGYEASSLRQEIVYNNTPDGSAGGIWQRGQGLAADDAGNIYGASGNGTVGIPGEPTNVRNRGRVPLNCLLPEIL